MPEIGFIYILVNPSYGKLIKIGKTTKDPEDRAKELSAATGVPTPFYVAYYEAVSDCDGAERFVHASLQQKGFRLSESKEFFDAPLKEAILVVQEASSLFKQASETDNNGQELIKNNATTDFERLLQETKAMGAANDAYYGTSNSLPNYKEAFKLYKRAAALGASDAYSRMADMYLEGKGVDKSVDAAIDCYQNGVKAGNIFCLPSLARIYKEKKDRYLETRCWTLFLKSIRERIPTKSQDEFWMQLVSLDLIPYLERTREGSIPFDEEFPFTTFADSILKRLAEVLEKEREFDSRISPTSPLLGDFYRQREEQRDLRDRYVRSCLGLLK